MVPPLEAKDAMKKSLSGSTSRLSSSIPRLQRSASLKVKHKDQTVEQTESKVSSPLRRSHSYSSSINRVKEPPAASYVEDDTSSIKSFSSCGSLASCDLGSTRNISRSSSVSGCKKYVVHCQREIQQSDEKYLTPTQRKDRQIRQLKAALVRATRGCEEKSVEIERLSSEIQRLKCSQSCTSGSQTCESPLTVLEEDISQGDQSPDEKNPVLHLGDVSKNDPVIRGGLEDSGILTDLFFDNPLNRKKCIIGKAGDFNLTLPSEKPHPLWNLEIDSNKEMKDLIDSCNRETQTELGRKPKKDFGYGLEGLDKNLNHPSFIQPEITVKSVSDSSSDSYWSSLEEMKRCHAFECQQLKECHNNKVESLLQKMSELNARYFDVRSAYEKTLERNRILDTQVSELKKEMAAQEEWHSQMYLKMYRKGHEAAKFEHADEVLEFAHKAPKRVSVPELLSQLHRTEHQLEQVKQLYRCEIYRGKDSPSGQKQNLAGISLAPSSNDRQAEYTLKFLKDAFYYYLTEKDNKGHLKAIESILGFSENERINVAKATRQKSRLV